MLKEQRINVLERAPLLWRMLQAHIFQPALSLITPFFFTLVILTGIPAGS